MFGKGHVRKTAHDPEKSALGFGQGHAQTKTFDGRQLP
jgi:hypothetical protein